MDVNTLEFRQCGGKHGPVVKSPYPKSKVPIKYFREDPEKESTPSLKQCWHCRIHHRNLMQKKRDRIKEEKEKHSKTSNPNTGYCSNAQHNKERSLYDRDKVPIELFRKVPGNKNSELFVTCLDCRTFRNKNDAAKLEAKRTQALESNAQLCASCNKDITGSKLTNYDGSHAKTCEKCQKKSRKWSKNRGVIYNRLKLEIITKSEVSCLRCKCLYFKPIGKSLAVGILNTYEKNDKRFTIVNNVEYSVTELLSMNNNYSLLELGIIEMDHMTEQEQRDAGRLKPNDPFVPKVDLVSSFRSESNMKLEALKCQHLCIKCHIEHTISREKGYVSSDGKDTKEKFKYVNALKAVGCVSCLYANPNLPRFFDLDHIDPETKVDDISDMTKRTTYSMIQLIEECKKCRVLCKHCHKIHTNRQFESGMFRGDYEETKLLDEFDDQEEVTEEIIEQRAEGASTH